MRIQGLFLWWTVTLEQAYRLAPQLWSFGISNLPRHRHIFVYIDEIAAVGQVFHALLRLHNGHVHVVHRLRHVFFFLLFFFFAGFSSVFFASAFLLSLRDPA